MSSVILTIELIPQSTKWVNVKKEFTNDEWKAIRSNCYLKAKYRCEICNSKGVRWPVECHEKWEFDEIQKKQTLKGFIALCPECHKVKHLLFAKKNNQMDIVLSQLMRVNNMSKEEAENYIKQCFDVWEERNRHQWSFDISYAKRYLNSDISN